MTKKESEDKIEALEEIIQLLIEERGNTISTRDVDKLSNSF